MRKTKRNLKVLALGSAMVGVIAMGGMFFAGCSLSGNNTQQEVAQDGISIHTPFKTTYYVGESLDVTGGIINYKVDGHATPVNVTLNMVTGFSSDNPGTRDLIITYQGYTTIITYTVNEIPAFLTSNAVYESKTKIDMNGTLSRLKIRYDGTYLKICPVNDSAEDYDYYNIPSYHGWDSDYSYSFSTSAKEFVNGTWSANETTIIDTGTGYNTKMTMNLTNATATSFHIIISIVSNNPNDSSSSFECDMIKI